MTEKQINEGKTMAFIAYLWLIGLVVALVMNMEKRNPFTSFHIRQALGLWLTFMVVGYMVSYFDNWLITISFWIFYGVLFIYAMFLALSGRALPIPLVGKLFQNLFSSVIK